MTPEESLINDLIKEDKNATIRDYLELKRELDAIMQATEENLTPLERTEYFFETTNKLETCSQDQFVSSTLKLRA